MSDEREIARLLRAEVPPGAGEARERTVAAARAAAALAEAAPPRRPGFRLVLASACAAGAFVAFSFTPPGRAVAGDVAELIGIGGPPTIDHDEQGGPFQPTSEEIVIAKGATEDATRFEIVAFEGKQSEQALRQRAQLQQQVLERIREAEEATGEESPPFVLPDVGLSAGTCIALDWIDQPNPRGGSVCIDGPPRNPLSIGGYSDTEGSYGPAAEVIVNGLTSPEVARVGVSYETPGGERVAADVALGRLEGELAERAGASQEFGAFFAFIPARHADRPEARAGDGGFGADVINTVEAVAYGESGEEIKREQFPDLAARSKGEQHHLVRFSDAIVFPMLDESGRPIPSAANTRPGALRSAGGCPRQTAALRSAGVELDAYAGLRCPDLEVVEKLVAAGRIPALERGAP